ncbi:MAG: hypothetical protein ACKVS8_01410 [Phycisphaerales bacterium]
MGLSAGLIAVVLLIACAATLGVLHALAAKLRDCAAVDQLMADVARLRAAYTQHLADAAARAGGAPSPPACPGEFDIVPDSPPTIQT